MSLLQSLYVVDFLRETHAEVSWSPRTQTVPPKFCYEDPEDHQLYLLNDIHDVEHFIERELTSEVSRSGNEFKLVFEESDWLHLGHNKVELIAALSRMKGVVIRLIIIDDEPSEEMIVRFRTKNRQSSL